MARHRLDRGVVRVTQELARPKGGGWIFAEPKTPHSTRPIRLPKETAEALRTLRKTQVQERLRRGLCPECEACRDVHCARWHDHDLVFCQPTGRPLHDHNLTQRDFRRLTALAKVPRIRFYDLRHLHFTLLAEEGVNLKAIKERAGHSTEAFTLARYIHATPDMQEQAARAVSRRLLSNGSLTESALVGTVVGENRDG